MTDSTRSPWKTFFLTAWVVVAPLTVSSAVTYYALTHEVLIARFGPATWLLIFLASCLTMGLALTPTTFVALISGYFLGMMALPGVIVSYLIASLIGFTLTRGIDQGQLMNTVYHWLGEPKAHRLRRLLQGVTDHQFGIIVMARLSPVLPFALMNVVLPIAGVRLMPFLVAGTLGMLPRTAFFVWLGSEAKVLRRLIEEGGEGMLPRLLLVGLLAISLAGFLYYGRRILRRQPYA